MTGFWDDPSVNPSGSGYMKINAVGDHIAGTIAKLGKRVFNEGTDEERVAIEVTFAEEDVPVMTAGQVRLRQALYHFKPAPGDWLSVTLSGVQKNGTKTMKLFAVELKRQDGSVESVDQNE